MAIVVTSTRGGGTVVRVEGDFDDEAQRWIEEFLTGLGPSSSATLDLGSTRVLHDVALGKLAESLRGTAAHVLLRGLDRHQQRLLQYLGVSAPGTATLPR